MVDGDEMELRVAVRPRSDSSARWVARALSRVAGGNLESVSAGEAVRFCECDRLTDPARLLEPAFVPSSTYC